MNYRLSPVALGLAGVLLPACGGDANELSGSAATMELVEASNGFGRLLPHEVRRVDPATEQPTNEIVAIRTQADLVNNVIPGNPVLPPTVWPTEPLLPNSEPGNHFIFATFRNEVDPASVFNPDGSLTGNVTMVAIDPVQGVTTPLQGRVFVGGKTMPTGGLPPGVIATPEDIPDLLEEWVVLDGGRLVPGADAPAEVAGFPGAAPQSTYVNAELVGDHTIVFVYDPDDNLLTFDTLPQGVQLRFRLSRDLQATNGNFLNATAVASSTVGVDSVRPEVAQSPPPFSVANITPGNGDIDVDPETKISVEFTEPIQLSSLGTLTDPPASSSAVEIQFTIANNTVSVPFRVDVPSVYDLSRVQLKPAFNLPGSPPAGVSSASVESNLIRVVVNSNQLGDLVSTPNLNALNASTSFRTGAGPGIVNAPVLPDTIYLARQGSSPSISVIDLNGFGQSTGNPTFDENCPIVEGNTNFPNDPNVATQGGTLVPPLTRGTTTLDGGSAGIFTLTKDSNLSDQLFVGENLSSVSDLMIGHPLDGTFNNGPPPFGCQSEGGNLCALTENKLANWFQNGNVLVPVGAANFGTNGETRTGIENPVSWAPHPNPPPLAFPPTCLSPFIAGQEPTSIDSNNFDVAGNFQGDNNLLGPGQGSVLGQPSTCNPPDGLLTRETNMWFVGPSLPTTNISSCTPFVYRQQIGHFLYVVDRVRGEVLVLNSNRFTLIDRIPLPDPTSMAMSPNIDFLAVSNQKANTVSFVDINPASSTFHEVVKETLVGRGPTGIAWDPGNEDILVCNQDDDTVSIISAFSFSVRKTLVAQLSGPFEVAITPRQNNFGFLRNVYFGWILNSDGTVAVFESGPNGQNGWGFDDIIGRPAFNFPNSKAIRADPTYLNGGVWIVHEDELGRGAVSNLVIASAATGQVALSSGSSFGGASNLRDLEFDIRNVIGFDQLTGIPVDIAFDNQRNLASLQNFSTPYSAGTPLPVNGKSLIKGPTFQRIPAYTPSFMFLAVPVSNEGPGVVDVINIDSGFSRFDTNTFEPGIQSIAASGVNIVVDYFRQ